MKTSELIKLLKASGCRVLRNGSNHDIWLAPNGNKIMVPRHPSKEVPTGTAKSILKRVGFH